MSDDEVKESAPYDNAMELLDEDFTPPTESNLADILGIDAPRDDAGWKEHWVGMPEFEQEENPSYKTVIVHFRTKEDYEKFADIIDQKLTDKTKSIWFPHLDATKNSLLRWIED